ncbi:Hydroxymethylpyrimidine ABC transporter, transmembrane component [Paenibacillus pasadenensis]|uniref:Hydroxymethylpyrimidine ABC transporter, transmembrane component n=3 Tax=Paenibacillus TaxID=44249 RepID=A0A2N5N646_9BACL|nr:Hydroxymethylpyrimidine ABC transporter, transmembrane component [Paenibacillus pasadenensis]
MNELDVWSGSGGSPGSGRKSGRGGRRRLSLSSMPESRLAELHRLYMKRSRRIGAAVLGVQLFVLAALLGLWEAAGRLRWIDPLLFSYPSKIAGLLASSSADGTLWPHVGVTVAETASGFLLGTLLGTALAALLWWFPFLARVCDPYLVVFNSLPKVALGPIFIVALGQGFVSILAVTLTMTVIVTTIGICNRFRDMEPGLVKVVRLLGGSRWQLFRLVILPGSFPVIISTLKVNVGLAWVGVIVGEFLVAKEGLGYLIIYGFQVFNFTLVLSTLVVIAVAATLMYQAVALLEKRIVSGGRD